MLFILYFCASMDIDFNFTERLHTFTADISDIPLPERFTFPFYYDPHPLALLASNQLQDYLRTQKEWQHNFGLDPAQSGMVIGKMFGVLVVRDMEGNLGFLAAFSGKLAGTNDHNYFVPPVFNMLTEGSFFLEGEATLNQMNRDIESLENNPSLANLRNQLEEFVRKEKDEINRLKEVISASKAKRKKLREISPPDTRFELEKRLSAESIREQLHLKQVKKKWRELIERTRYEIQVHLDEINRLKNIRKSASSALQQQLFEQYAFFNKDRETKSLLDIFVKEEGMVPPAGAGECAAPKLLHYAFRHRLEPITMAEFWWGESPPGEVRIHRHFYPVCRSKCRPILRHMLSGIKLDPNPMETLPAEDKRVEIIYRDEDIAVIYKPEELLSVPGKSVQMSVFTQISALIPEATGPLMVHRLDMSTSGVMVIALNMPAYRHLQRQFLRKTVKKSYLALLERDVTGEVATEGEITLPLRVDLDDRPRQMVCYEYGRKAHTTYRIENVQEGRTRIRLYPHTGRTHQLRVHAAHHSGLNAPILGDDLYGQKNKRLYLHAETLSFRHPVSGQWMEFTRKAPF